MKKLFAIALLPLLFTASAALADLALAPEVKCYAAGEVIPGVPDPAKECCPGLKRTNAKDAYDSECKEVPIGGYAGVCLACGDGACDAASESKCNCPEDCGQK